MSLLPVSHIEKLEGELLDLAEFDDSGPILPTLIIRVASVLETHLSASLIPSKFVPKADSTYRGFNTLLVYNASLTLMLSERDGSDELREVLKRTWSGAWAWMQFLEKNWRAKVAQIHKLPEEDHDLYEDLLSMADSTFNIFMELLSSSVVVGNVELLAGTAGCSAMYARLLPMHADAPEIPHLLLLLAPEGLDEKRDAMKLAIHAATMLSVSSSCSVLISRLGKLLNQPFTPEAYLCLHLVNHLQSASKKKGVQLDFSPLHLPVLKVLQLNLPSPFDPGLGLQVLRSTLPLPTTFPELTDYLSKGLLPAAIRLSSKEDLSTFIATHLAPNLFDESVFHPLRRDLFSSDFQSLRDEALWSDLEDAVRLQASIWDAIVLEQDSPRCYNPKCSLSPEENTELVRCPWCSVVRYCSESCHLAYWHVHRAECFDDEEGMVRLPWLQPDESDLDPTRHPPANLSYSMRLTIQRVLRFTVSLQHARICEEIDGSRAQEGEQDKLRNIQLLVDCTSLPYTVTVSSPKREDSSALVGTTILANIRWGGKVWDEEKVWWSRDMPGGGFVLAPTGEGKAKDVDMENPSKDYDEANQ